MNYWLYIEPYVYISIGVREVILYNTLNNKYLTYSDSNCIKLFKKLKENNNTVSLNKVEFDNYIDILKVIKGDFFGDVIETGILKNKPTQFPSTFYNYLTEESYQGIKVINQISKIDIQLTDICSMGCSNCNRYYKQIDYCYSKRTRNQLDLNKLLRFLDPLKTDSNYTINLYGGDIRKYNCINELVQKLNVYNCVKIYNLHYKIIDEGIIKTLSNERNLINIYITLEDDLTKNVYDKIKSLKTYSKVLFTFIIENSEQLKIVNNYVEIEEIQNFFIYPVYNDNNQEFIRGFLNLDIEKAREYHKEIKDIFINETINTINYGVLKIDCSGNIYSNYNSSLIGNIDMYLHDIVYNELFSNGSNWLYTRKKIKQCNGCAFLPFCPPVSNYEHVLKNYLICERY